MKTKRLPFIPSSLSTLGMLALGSIPNALFAQDARGEGRSQAVSGEASADGEDIIVRGTPLPGAVMGDIKPEQQLSPADVRALGVSSISELLTELGPQTNAAGGAPVVLLNGKRISSFSEIQDLPTEAIMRVDILPEEVALTYGYSPTQKVLNGLSFKIKEGETVAFVGPIGCGKSTIMNLLLRFLEQDAGKISIGGEDITEVTLASLREQVSKLSQFPFFLKDTIRENVRLGRVGATDAEVEQACRLANIHDTIVNEIPGGYNCTVGDQVPSGGQKRLIAFARCLIRQPEVLLLDEPTENLNETNRIEMAKFVHNYAKGENKRTCIVISHDMNFVHIVADRIIVIDKGKAVQSGTHAELLQQDGIYKTLYELKNINPDLLRTREGGAAAAAGEPDELPPGFAPA